MGHLDDVLNRLGFDHRPDADLGGLRDVYAAWCLSVPFDNIAKLIALRAPRGAPLPGMDAAEFFGRWLEHGVGGTCWITSNALCELLLALGFEARRVAGSMGDSGYLGHGSVKVRLGCETTSAGSRSARAFTSAGLGTPLTCFIDPGIRLTNSTRA